MWECGSTMSRCVHLGRQTKALVAPRQVAVTPPQRGRLASTNSLFNAAAWTRSCCYDCCTCETWKCSARPLLVCALYCDAVWDVR